MLSPTTMSERSLRSRGGSFSNVSMHAGNYTGRSLGGRSEMSDASAMSVSPRIMPEGGGSKWEDELNPPSNVPTLSFQQKEEPREV